VSLPTSEYGHKEHFEYENGGVEEVRLEHWVVHTHEIRHLGLRNSCEEFEEKLAGTRTRDD
jgi:hypothetical protein